MSRTFLRFDRFTVTLPLFVFPLALAMTFPLCSGTVGGQEPAEDRVEETRSDMVRFSFAGVAWRDVIEWIAEEADLALHMDTVPSGSFNYRDPSPFTHEDAIDRINLFLLPEGYSLVRNGNLLSVINLSDPRSMQQLDAMADLVTVKELESRKPHDVVKCLFPLGSLGAEDAVEELSALKLMVQPTILSKTKQLLITETVAKLKSVKSILDSFEPSQLDNGTIVKSFELEHVEAEDVLVVARPHLGLATGEMIGIDVSLSSDLQGKFIFATGIEDKVLLIEKLVQSIDVPQPSQIQDDKSAELHTYKVVGGNVDLAYDVLLTLLAGQDARLSKNETAGTLVAFATPAVHRQIEGTIAKLAAEEPDFEVIPLRTVDPYVAIGLVEQMLNLSAFDDDDRDEDELPPPNIDADPENRRLFVRGTAEQIAQVKKIVEGLDTKEKNFSSQERIRLLPLYGSHAQQTLQLAARFWRKPNPILLFQSDSLQNQETERVLHAPGARDSANNDLVDAVESLGSRTPSQFVSAPDRGRVLSSPSADITQDAIECQLTTRGLLVQCNDLEVLNQFQEHVETLAGPGAAAPSEPIVYYLKYTRPEDALRMLAELIDGGEAVDPSSDSLVNASISSSFLSGSLITNREGTLTLIAGTLTVVADSRLNRLIVQGTTEDVERIESYLRIIEKDTSITSIETNGRSRVIELVNTRAAEVEAALRKAFAGRVAAATTGAAGQQPGGGESQRQDPRAKEKAAGNDKNAKKSPKAPSQQARDLAPKMTLAVHEPSNSLIVTAPDALFDEVEKLAMIIDDRAEQSIEILTPSSSVLETVLEELVLGQSGERRPSSSRDRDRERSKSR